MHRIELPAHLTNAPFGYAQARAEGIGDGRLRNPELARPFRGARMSSTSTDTLSLCRAFAARTSSEMFFSGTTAAKLWGIPLPVAIESDIVLEASVPRPARALRVRGVRCRSVTVTASDIATRHGLSISSVERTWCELALVLPEDDLIVAGDHLLYFRRPLTTAESLRSAMERFPDPRARAAARRAFGQLSDRCGSPRETRVHRLLRLAGITGYVLNKTIVTPFGTYVGDFVFPRERVVVEYQGGYHNDPRQWRRDLTRKRRLEAQGWYVLEITSDDLADIRMLVDELGRILASRR